jgi:SpoVK/Ycf46/Vps4 family AAA+-type ATPase
MLIDCGEDAPPPAATQLAERMRGVVFLAASRPVRLRRAALRHEVAYPDRGERRRLWVEALGDSAPPLAAEVEAVATGHRLSARLIAATAAELRADRTGPDGAGLRQACRRAVPPLLADLACRIEPAAGWDDLVLPEAQKRTLAQIAVHMRHRATVYDAWRFAGPGARGLGVSALFVGESGTGKTMAAEVLARELGLDLFRIDLSGVVSKYIGETEKNLRQVFAAAEGSGAALLFDEADALFGKRSEVRDSHDRYANIEVSYLLQQMEAFPGLSILTTNQKSALDGAFMRRLRFVVAFPFPEAAEREAIWRRAFPPAAPVGDLAWDKLARLQVSGGQIRNIALAAAFLAADCGQEVRMTHLLQAAHAESAKRERPLADAETRGWA